MGVVAAAAVIVREVQHAALEAHELCNQARNAVCAATSHPPAERQRANRKR